MQMLDGNCWNISLACNLSLFLYEIKITPASRVKKFNEELDSIRPPSDYKSDVVPARYVASLKCRKVSHQSVPSIQPNYASRAPDTHIVSIRSLKISECVVTRKIIRLSFFPEIQVSCLHPIWTNDKPCILRNHSYLSGSERAWQADAYWTVAENCAVYLETVAVKTRNWYKLAYSIYGCWYHTCGCTVRLVQCLSFLRG